MAKPVRRSQGAKAPRKGPYSERITLSVTPEEHRAIQVVSERYGFNVRGVGAGVLRRRSLQEVVDEYRELIRTGEIVAA